MSMSLRKCSSALEINVKCDEFLKQKMFLMKESKYPKKDTLKLSFKPEFKMGFKFCGMFFISFFSVKGRLLELLLEISEGSN